jgi:hypothetical protein
MGLAAQICTAVERQWKASMTLARFDGRIEPERQLRRYKQIP